MLTHEQRREHAIEAYFQCGLRLRVRTHGATAVNPLVPVSWGELIDKITILEIRQEPLLTPAARANATHELPPLRAVAAELGEAPSGLASLRERAGRRRLKRAINELLGPDIIEEKQYADYRNGA